MSDDPAQKRIEAHLDEQDAAADWRPVDVDLAEIFGSELAAMIEADYQRRVAAHDAMIERHRREREEWQRREEADREWMKANGFWSDETDSIPDSTGAVEENHV